MQGRISVAVLFGVLLALLVLAPDVVLTIFAGILVAVFLRGGGTWIAARLGLAPGWGIGIFVLLLIGALAVAGLFFSSEVVRQAEDLAARIPQAASDARDRLEELPGASRILERLTPTRWLSDQGGGVTTAVTSTFGALGNAILIIFIGLYGAIDPGLYRRGLIALVAPSRRDRAEAVVSDAADTLRSWLSAQLISMSVVGVLTGIGLWLVGMPLAIMLGLISGLLAFIPNIGPVLAAAPGLLLALSQGRSMVLWVLGVYVAVQTLESYLITPIVQQQKVALPPALVISAQLLFGVLFGLLGLALAMPLAALAMSVTKSLYIEDYLEREPR